MEDKKLGIDGPEDYAVDPIAEMFAAMFRPWPIEDAINLEEEVDYEE